MVSEMKEKAQKARKGFTLVELLIVIIIIGILAGAMMLVAGSSRDAAEASKIISDLRNVKAASLMWMADNPTTVESGDWTGLETNPDPLNKYLDRPLIEGSHNFLFEVVESGDFEAWVLGYDLGDTRAGVISNLKKQAPSAGLYKQLTELPPDSADFYDGSGNVYVIVQ